MEKTTASLNTTKNLMIGILVGGLAGATAMLLFAPRSGQQTLDNIQQKSIELRDQTTAEFKKAFAQIRSKTGSITTDVLEKADELKHLGMDKVVDGLDRVNAAVKAV